LKVGNSRWNTIGFPSFSISMFIFTVIMLAYCQYLPLHIFILGFRLSVATRCEVVEVVPSLNPVRNFDPQSAKKKSKVPCYQRFIPDKNNVQDGFKVVSGIV